MWLWLAILGLLLQWQSVSECPQSQGFPSLIRLKTRHFAKVNLVEFGQIYRRLQGYTEQVLFWITWYLLHPLSHSPQTSLKSSWFGLESGGMLFLPTHQKPFQISTKRFLQMLSENILLRLMKNTKYIPETL